MCKITEVTLRDIIDIIRNGFVGSEPQTKVDYYEWEYTEKIPTEYKMCYHGRLDEIDFLSRLYNLDSMPSSDSCFRNALGDIRRHTVNNDDWDLVIPILIYWLEKTRFFLISYVKCLNYTDSFFI